MNIVEYLKRNALSILLLGSFSGCTGAVMYPAFNHAKTSAWRSSCQSNLKAIAMASFQYQADYDGRFAPLSDGSSRGWVSLLARYEKTEGFSCPAGYKSSFSPSSDYFFNAQLATKRQNDVRDPMFTVAFGDGMDNGASNSHLSEVSNDWDNENSGTYRHRYGSNYAFADGHVKMVRPQLLSKWTDYNTDESAARLKFAPEEAGFRVLPKRKPAPHRSVNPAKKRLKDLVHAAQSFPNSKSK